MSHANFLTALAEIIRTPYKQHDIDLDAIIDSYELSPKEKRQLKVVADEEQVEFYGLEQARERWDALYHNLFYLRIFLYQDILEDIWFQRFEPMAQQVAADDMDKPYTLAYLSCLLEDELAKETLIEQAGPWAIDLVKFEQAELLQIELAHSGKKPNLKHHYTPIRLDYDIPEALEAARNEEDQERVSQVVPKEKELHLLISGGHQEQPIETNLVSKELWQKLASKEPKLDETSSEQEKELRELGLI